MTRSNFQPEPQTFINDLEALKVIADPLRNQIMEMLTPQPMTINLVAQNLGVDSSKLYYHFNLLEKHGFIKVVDTTLHGNLIEKHYWVTAYDFKMEGGMFNFSVDTPEGTENLTTLLLANIEATSDDLQRSLHARHQQISQGAEPNPRSVLDYRRIFNIPDEKAEDFHKRLRELLNEFQGEEVEEDDTHPWALTVVMYPSFYFPPDNQGTDTEKDK